MHIDYFLKVYDTAISYRITSQEINVSFAEALPEECIIPSAQVRHGASACRVACKKKRLTLFTAEVCDIYNAIFMKVLYLGY